jgi:hypothetical protein
VRAVDDGYMPERHFSVTPEAVPYVRRYLDNIARFGDDVDTVNRVDASSFAHNEHLAAGVAMLRRADAVGVAADADVQVDAVIVAANDSS